MAGDSTRQPIVVTHEGGVRFGAQIRSHRIVTDQPQRAGGDDSAPMPIELLGASLGTCIAFYVQQFLHTRHLSTDGLRVEVEQRSERNPNRVGAFAVRVILPPSIPTAYLEMLERAARSCPAHNTFTEGADVQVAIESPTVTQTAVS